MWCVNSLTLDLVQSAEEGSVDYLHQTLAQLFEFHVPQIVNVSQNSILYDFMKRLVEVEIVPFASPRVTWNLSQKLSFIRMRGYFTMFFHQARVSRGTHSPMIEKARVTIYAFFCPCLFIFHCYHCELPPS